MSENKNNSFRNASNLVAGLSNIANFGLSLISPIFILTVLALWIEKKFGVGDWLTVCAIICGLISGGCTFYNFARAEIRKADREVNNIVTHHKNKKQIDTQNQTETKKEDDDNEQAQA